MSNQPASYVAGNTVTIPYTTHLRYDQPGYTTYDASLGVAKDNWTAQAVRPEPEQFGRQHVHLLGAVHQVGSAAASARGAASMIGYKF